MPRSFRDRAAMKLAFCLFKYFPFGGLQRDFLQIAQLCQRRGHQIDVFTMDWYGPVPEGLTLHLIKVRGIMHHTRCSRYARKTLTILKRGGYDAVIGFNKMPGLDLYYAADPCYQARAREKYRPKYGPLYWWTPRFRSLVALEQAVFGALRKTEILLLAETQRELYIRYYGTPSERFHLLPPGIWEDRVPPDNAREVRNQMRRDFLLADDHKLLLMVGSGFTGKGVDRALRACAALAPALRRTIRLVVIGQGKPGPFLRLASRLELRQQVSLLSGREDIARFFLGADLLIHPAYSENTGTVILEAMVCGLPVLVTDVCGYAFHVARAHAGRVLPSPFEQEELNRALEEMLASPLRSTWSRNGIAYGLKEDLYSRSQVAVSFIEQTARRKHVTATPSPSVMAEPRAPEMCPAQHVGHRVEYDDLRSSGFC